jgi:hypothetical protein
MVRSNVNGALGRRTLDMAKRTQSAIRRATPPRCGVRHVKGVDMGTAFSQSAHEIYTYNDRSELLTGKRYTGTNPTDTSNPMTGRQFSYEYDNIGNRTAHHIDANTTTYTLDTSGLNQYVSTANPSESFGYDADGNMTHDGTLTYEWDAENRLRAQYPTVITSSSRKIEWTYDYLGRRVRRLGSGRNANNTAWLTPDFERQFLYDGWNTVMLINGLPTPTTTRTYTWGLDLSGLSGNNQGGGGPYVAGIHGAGGIGGLLATYDPSVTPTHSFIYCYDANGNVGQLLDIANG